MRAQISPIGAIPKNRPGKWTIITDLSSSAGTSVNDAISKELLSLKYTSLDHLSSLILPESKGAFLVKADIKKAYRMMPAHPDNQLLMGVLWDGRVYMEKMLPFCLSSEFIIFSAVADALQWILIKKHIPKLLRYFYMTLF